MHFAKLFTFPVGQLLVTKEYEEHATAPYLLQSELRHEASGVTMKTTGGFKDEARRDAEFEAMDEDRALTYFTAQRKQLDAMS